MKWSNPHILFSLRGTDAAGAEAHFEIESHSLSLMRRMQIPADAISIGETVRVAGNPAHESDRQIFARTALLSDGQEVVLDPWTEPRWAENAGSKEGTQASPVANDELRAALFRVWSTALDDPSVFPFPETINPPAVNDYPLTDYARQRLAAFDPETDTPTLNCTPKGMPATLSNPTRWNS